MDCFKYLGSQVAVDGDCVSDMVHRMNERYRAWGALKSVLNNRGLGINVSILGVRYAYRGDNNNNNIIIIILLNKITRYNWKTIKYRWLG